MSCHHWNTKSFKNIRTVLSWWAIVGLRIAREVAFYSLVHFVSSLSMLIDFYLFSDPIKFEMALVFAFSGMVTALLSLWDLGEAERPVGVTLLALSYGVGGIIAIFLGGWVLTMLFLLALVFFVVAWGLLKGKTWARIAAMILTCLGLILSFLGVVNNGVVYLPGVFQAVYILWYLNRPHIGSYFTAESLWNVDVTRKILVPVFVIFVGAAILLFNTYENPPTYTLVSDNFETWGTGGGGMGRIFSAKHEDFLAYSFQVDGGGPVKMYIESHEYPFTVISSTEVAISGTGSVKVPFDGSWVVKVDTQGTYMDVQVKLELTQFSLRASVVQLLLLAVCCGALALFWALRSRRVAMSFYV